MLSQPKKIDNEYFCDIEYVDSPIYFEISQIQERKEIRIGENNIERIQELESMISQNLSSRAEEWFGVSEDIIINCFTFSHNIGSIKLITEEDTSGYSQDNLLAIVPNKLKINSNSFQVLYEVINIVSNPELNNGGDDDVNSQDDSQVNIHTFLEQNILNNNEGEVEAEAETGNENEQNENENRSTEVNETLSNPSGGENAICDDANSELDIEEDGEIVFNREENNRRDVEEYFESFELQRKTVLEKIQELRFKSMIMKIEADKLEQDYKRSYGQV